MPDPAPAGDSHAFDDLLRRAAAGDAEARKRLWSENYETLRGCAERWLAQHWNRGANTISLCATEILHGVYERLHDRTAAFTEGKAFWFRAFYTECMRFAIDHYRRTRNDKGRGELKRVEFQSQFLLDHGVQQDFDVVYTAIGELGDEDERLGQIALLKVFETRPNDDGKGARSVTNAEVAELLGIGLRTVEQDWSFAKAWLLKRLM